MLTRPGSAPGSGWMRDVSERLASGPADTRPVPRRIWVLYLVFMISALVILPMLGRRAVPSYNVRSYESSSRVAGLPVFASGAAPVEYREARDAGRRFIGAHIVRGHGATPQHRQDH